MFGLAVAFLVLRAFSSGWTALTGAEAIMFAGITALALISNVHYTENTCALDGFTGNCVTDRQRTVIAQIAAAVFGGDQTVAFYYMQATAALILILAANTAHNGFPLLGSILAQDRYLPRQLHTRGDRLAFSIGIVVLAAVAGGLIYLFDGSATLDVVQPGPHPAGQQGRCSSRTTRTESRYVSYS